MRQAGDESSLERARRRLDAAIDTLEAAISHRQADDRQRDALEAQIQAFGSDRATLAAELDRVRAHSDGLDSANREVSRRLEHAVDTIRAVLAAHER